MRKVIITTAALTLMCGSAFAQSSTGPAGRQDNMTKPGVTRGTMEKGSGANGSMDRGTVGMERGGVLPDASGQGGSGPGSDQGGTRTPPGNMK
jgi:hypothetical protein